MRDGMKVTMIGAGYVGLTTSACFAELGHDVTCIDVIPERVAALSRGEIPIYEPGLQELMTRNVGRGRLRFSGDSEAAKHADAVFLAVGTPSGPTGDINLSHLETAGRQIAKAIRPGAVVVIKSTVVTGTCRWLREVIAEARGGLDFSVASNPEFLREGSAISDFMQPDRIVIGADDRRASRLLEELYRPLTGRGVRLLVTNTANAELIKYASNAFLAMKIGFINDIANLCEKTGGDVEKVAEGIGLDKRIGASFLAPGPGFGGSCFPKDTRAFAATGRKHGAPQPLIETLIEENEKRKAEVARRILRELPARGRKATVAVLGLAFKANTDDVREAASLTVIPLLQNAGVTIRVHDPKAMEQAALYLRNVEWCACPYQASRDADMVVILTEWSAFRMLDLSRIAAAMRGKTLLDFRNIFVPADVTRHGLRYVSVGRAALPSAAVTKVDQPARRGGPIKARAQLRDSAH
jgi:UDPglucose 6-dehydrogenase